MTYWGSQRLPGRPKTRGERCEVPGCGRPHHAVGFCEIHYGRQRNGVDLDLPVRGSLNATLTALTEAALAYAEAETDEEFSAAQQRLTRAAEAYRGVKRANRSGTSRKQRARRKAIGRGVVRGEGAKPIAPQAGSQEAA